MKAGEFLAEEWIDRLTQALRDLAEVQEPFLQGYHRHHSRAPVVQDVRNGNRRVFPLDDASVLYSRACHKNPIGEDVHYEPLHSALNPVRYVLMSHPTLARVVGPIIGQDEFWMQILDSGTRASPTNLIAGLMARAAELSGDRFRAAAAELNAFLTPDAGDGSASMLGGLDVGYDVFLFYGLTVKERTDVVDGMAILPFEQVQGFVDGDLVESLAPRGAGYHRWQPVGAVVRPFRWRPAFRRTWNQGGGRNG